MHFGLLPLSDAHFRGSRLRLEGRITKIAGEYSSERKCFIAYSFCLSTCVVSTDGSCAIPESGGNGVF